MLRYFALCLLLCSPAYGQAIQRLDSVKMAPITVRRPNGQTLSFGLGASTAAARGTALMAAQTAATSGDTIEVSAGTYTPGNTEVIGKTGVSYDFAPGAIVQKTSTNGSTTNTLITDAGGELTGTIGGNGEFINASQNTNKGVCLSLTDTDTDCTIRAQRIHNNASGGSVYACETGTGSVVRLYVEEDVTSDTYDAFIIDSTSGSFSVYADEINAPDNAMEWNGGDVYVKVREANCSGAQSSGVAIMASNSGTLTFDGGTLIGSATAGQGFPAISGQRPTVSTSNFFGCEIIGSVYLANSGRNYFRGCTIDAGAKDCTALELGSNATVLNNCAVEMKATESYWVEPIVENVIFSNAGGSVLVEHTGEDHATGTAVRFEANSGALPSNISAGTTYYTVRISSTTSKLAATYAEALAGTPLISYVSAGTPSNSMRSARTLNIEGSITVKDQNGNVLDPGTYASPLITLSYSGKTNDSVKLAGTTPTATGLALLDDASITAQRNTLGATNGTWGASLVEGATFSVDGAGTAAPLASLYATLDFGTTDPTITITRAGTYLILARVEIVDNSLTAQSSPKFKLRRTNNTAGDLSNSESALTLPTSSEYVIYPNSLAPMIYTTANANDVIALYGQDADEAGLTVSKASIRAIQIPTGTP